MNDKWINVAVVLTFIVIATNGFILYTSAFPDQNGDPLLLQFRSVPIIGDACSLDVDTTREKFDAAANSTAVGVEGASTDSPVQAQGFSFFDFGAIFDVTCAVSLAGFGFQGYMFLISSYYPGLAPITNSVVIIVSILELMALLWFVRFGRQLIGRPFG